MKLNQLRNVVAVAERGSLRAAARQLRIAQPALTRSIRELERELGAVLFERRARGMVATPMGERFIRRAQGVLRELNLARDEIGQLQGTTSGRVSICLGVLPHLTLLPHALSMFRARYPNVDIEIIEGRFPAVEASLKGASLDFFVGPLPDAIGREFIIEKLYDQDMAVLCRKGHPLAKTRSLRQLTEAEWLTTSVTVEPADELAPIFARFGIEAPRVVAQSHSALTILAVVGYSDLLVLLPAELARSALGKPLLQRIELTERIPDRPIVMIRRAALPLTPAAEYFADMLRRGAAQYIARHSLRAKVQRAGTAHRKLAASSGSPRPV